MRVHPPNFGYNLFTLPTESNPMRPFEILLIVVFVLVGLRFIIHRGRMKPLADIILLAALLIFLPLHVLLEHARWQMIPFYGLFLPAFALLAWNAMTAVTTRLQRWRGWLMLMLALLFSLPPVLFPVPVLPLPTGKYAVGTAQFYWVDTGRIDPYDGKSRRLMVQVWYPVEPGQTAGLSLAPYFDRLEIAGPVISQEFGLPAFTLNHINLAHTYSYLDAPAAEGTAVFPVLLFSHGWTGFRAQNTFQMEELASQGFVVFSADHTYGAAVVTFPDGSVVLNNPDALPKAVSDAEYDRAARILGQTWVGDLHFTLDQVEKIQSGEIASPLAGRLDLERVGALGHSTGGGAVVEFCFSDARCKAGLTMDAWLIPYDRAIPEQGLRQPFLFMQSEKWQARRNPALVTALYDHSGSGSYHMTIAGTGHYDFSDLPLLTPIAPLIGLKGPIPSSQMTALVNAYTTRFFNQALRGEAANLLTDLAQQFPQVKFFSLP
jgi:hypothetical protein